MPYAEKPKAVMRRRTTVAILLLLASAFLSQAAIAATASLNVLWSKPVESQTRSISSDLVLRNLTRSRTEPVVVLGSEKGSQVILAPNSASPGPVKHLGEKATILSVAKRGATIWVGGLTNRRAYVPGGDIADRYLGKLDAQGNVIAEYSFRSGNWGLIEDLLPLPSGDAMVAGRDGSTAWIAHVSSEGKFLWEQRFGIGKRIGIAELGDQIAAVAFDAVRDGDKSKYREDVRVWRFSRSGKRLGSQPIREGINFRSGANYGRVALERSGDAVYAITSFPDLFAPRAIEVSKLDTDGRAIWSKTLPKTIWKESDRGKSWLSCKEGKAALANGDLLIACAAGQQILLFQLDASDGEVTERSIPLPECNKGRPAALFLHQNSDGALWLFGSRPEGNFGAGCTWLGELILKN